MPGGRLTYTDREAIAKGLAEGVGFAEIARRLQRPTSTVSREVTRNGGPDAYQADAAHEAASRRARGRKPAHPPKPAATSAYGRDPEAVHEFERRFTAIMIQTGVPRMMARVLVALFTSDSGSFTAAELAQRLHVSPASVSKAVAQLEALELITRERDPRLRRERYFVDEDVWYHAWTRRLESIALWVDTAGRGAELFGIDTPAGARLDEMRKFLGLVSHDLAEVTAHWRRFFAAERARRAAAIAAGTWSPAEPGPVPEPLSSPLSSPRP